ESAFLYRTSRPPAQHSFPTRRSSDLVGGNRVHADVVVVGDRVAVEGLRLGHVGARVGAPVLADGAHRARALAEERVVRLPVHLLVLEADERDARVRALLEGAPLPAVDEVGPVD